MTVARQTATALRQDIEERLAKRVPAALTPSVRANAERTACGVHALDECLLGGLPVGAVTELVGVEGSGRTTMALAYAAGIVQDGNVAAWVDVEDVLDPESAARSGVDCGRLLWVRCGHSPGVHEEPAAGTCTALQTTRMPGAGQTVSPSGGGSPHPRSEGRGMPQAIRELLTAQPRSSALPLRRRDKSIGTPGAPNRPLPGRVFDREEQVPTDRRPPRRGAQLARVASPSLRTEPELRRCNREPDGPALVPMHARERTSSARFHAEGSQGTKQSWTRLDQALRATDLLLQYGGFRLIVLDLGSVPAEKSLRIPLATWFRFRAACERTRASLLLLTQHPCARSSAELVVRMEAGRMEGHGTVLTGFSFCSEVEKQRFQASASNVVPIRKPPQSARPGAWKGQASWAI